MSRLLKTGTNQITTKCSNSHMAVDLVKYKSQPDYILAHSDGKVTWVQTGHKNAKGSTGNASYGNCIKIDHANGYSTIYAHLKEVYVVEGQTVTKGQAIGYMGNTGNSYGAHLHFEIRKNNIRIDPTPYLDSDLPGTSNNKITCEYRVWDNVKKCWLPKVKDTLDHAGNLGNSIGGFQLITHGGGITKIRAHVLNGEWLDEVIDGGFEEGDNNYVGIKGKPIDGIAIWSQYGDATYRVHIKGGVWLEWVSGKYDINNLSGYAGILGKEIDAIECYIK